MAHLGHDTLLATLEDIYFSRSPEAYVMAAGWVVGVASAPQEASSMDTITSNISILNRFFTISFLHWTFDLVVRLSLEHKKIYVTIRRCYHLPYI